MKIIKYGNISGEILEKIEEKIPEKAVVKLTNMTSHKEIMYNSNPNYKIKIKKLDRDRYILLDTGEIKNYDHTISRNQNINNVVVTLKKLRNLINHNFWGDAREKMFTITYKENMRDTEKLYKDFEKFIKKVRYNLGDLDYINIVEPQGRGAWHCHILLKFIKYTGFIDSEYVERLWAKGFVSVKAIKKSITNLGAYLSAYLTNLEYSKSNEKMILKSGAWKTDISYKYIEIEGKSKKFIKGGRLYLYPTGTRIFRKSKGIVEPPIEKIRYKNFKEEYNLEVAKYRRKIEILDDNFELITKLIYEQY